MTAQGNSTAPGGDNKLTATKALFVGFFAIALGWAGVLVAAVAVATEQSWSKGRPERERAGERTAGWLDTQRAWLDQDHRERTARAQSQQDWLSKGAPVDGKPKQPSKLSRVGAALRRVAANVSVAAADFASGFRDGWKTADERRRSGAGFRDILRGRHDTTDQPTADQDHEDLQVPDQTCWNCRRDGVAVDSTGVCADCDDTVAGHSEYRWNCDKCSTGRGGYRTAEQADSAGQAHIDFIHSGAGSIYDANDYTIPDYADENLTAATEGEPMGTYQDGVAADKAANLAEQEATARANAAYAGVPYTGPKNQPASSATTTSAASDVSNAVVLAGKLTAINSTVTGVIDNVDTLGVTATELRQKIAQAADLAHSSGMPREAVAAVDAIEAAAASIGAHLDDFATATAGASDQLASSIDGLRPVNQAEDKLRAAGADGRALDSTAV